MSYGTAYRVLLQVTAGADKNGCGYCEQSKDNMQEVLQHINNLRDALTAALDVLDKPGVCWRCESRGWVWSPDKSERLPCPVADCRVAPSDLEGWHALSQS